MKKIVTLIFFAISININAQVLVEDIAVGNASSYPQYIHPFRDGIVYIADNQYISNNFQEYYYYNQLTNSNEVFYTPTSWTGVSNGINGISQCMSNGSDFNEIDGVGYFFTGHFINGVPVNYRHLNSTDGTLAGTIQLPDSLMPASIPFKLQGQICVLCWLDNMGSAFEPTGLYIYNPQTNQAHIKCFDNNSNKKVIGDLRKDDAYVNYPYATEPFIANNSIYFTYTSWSYNTVFCKMDTNCVMTILDSTTTYFYEQAIVNDKLIFYGEESSPSSNGAEPYVFDFLTGDVSLLKNINPNYDQDSEVEFIHFHHLDTFDHYKIFFTAFDYMYGSRLWETDGTSQGTNPIGPDTPADYFGVYHGDTLYTIDDYAYRWIHDGKIYSIDADAIISVVNNSISYPIDTLLWSNGTHYPICTNDEDNGIILADKGFLYFQSSAPYYAISTGYELFKFDLDSLNVTSIDEFHIKNNESEFCLSPNPSNGKFTLDFKKNVNKMNIKLFSSMGQLIYKKENFAGEKMQFDLNLEKGVYYLNCNVSDETNTLKVIIN